MAELLHKWTVECHKTVDNRHSFDAEPSKLKTWMRFIMEAFFLLTIALFFGLVSWIGMEADAVRDYMEQRSEHNKIWQHLLRLTQR